MCERPKIHVFLGDLPPSSEVRRQPPADFKHLKLTWQDGHLRPAAGESDQDALRADWTTEGSGPHHLSCHLEDEGPSSDSVFEYLDSCFPTDQADHQTGSKANLGVSHLTEQTQYLSTWTLSQALILRGRHGMHSAASSEKALQIQTPSTDVPAPSSVSSSTPELFSPVPLSMEASAELFSQPSLTLRAERGGVVIEATPDGVLCSQDAVQAPLTSRQSPESKRARILDTVMGEAPEAPSDNRNVAELRCPTTLLNQCNRKTAPYTVLVAVVHPCHLKEVKIKSGPAAGTFVPLASIVVTDQSGVEMKVLLWRRAALWVLTVCPGDILLISGLRVNHDKWRGETVLQSTFSSKLLNLGTVSSSNTPPAPKQVHARSLASLCGFLRQQRPLLASLNARPPQDLKRLPYVNLNSLRTNTLVHAWLHVAHTQLGTEWRSEAESCCRSAVQMKAIISVEQPGSQHGVLVLWGAAVQWLSRLTQNKAAVWDFRNLLVREGLTSELPELHSTPWSSVQALDPAHPKAQEFVEQRSIQRETSIELDLDTLLSQKYSGAVELRVQVTSFHFQDFLTSQRAPRAVLDNSTPLDGIVAVLNDDITYTGCGLCATELDTDANGIYVPCYPCLPHTAVRRYYRAGMLTVRGQGSSQVRVQVPPVLLQKILEAPPDKLHRSSAPGSKVKHIQVAAEKIHSLLSLPRKVMVITIQSHFLCDENSVPVAQDFTLLDLQFSS
ncbi:Protein FAM35A [Takifugu flavidus]|uniref:Protein FAM35A n=2 Tax=Takifugu flavidus TaxID=433684 RepID=A0A5C6PJU9_9TELE|nr:Protein FAM35A [Takifugu flavidus]